MAVKQMKQQKFKKGQKVAWGSQAGGIRTTKKGTVVAVVNTPMIDLPKTEKLAILRELHPELSKKELERKAMFVTTEQALSEQYHLKFSPLEGWRDKRKEPVHYLVAVDRGPKRKKALYHPVTKHLTPIK